MKDTIRNHYNRAHALAMAEVVRLAREAMAKDPRLVEFVMGMGIWGFWDAANNQMFWDDSVGRPAAVKRLERFIDLWDDVLKLTGDALRFKQGGPIVRKW